MKNDMNVQMLINGTTYHSYENGCHDEMFVKKYCCR